MRISRSIKFSASSTSSRSSTQTSTRTHHQTRSFANQPKPSTLSSSKSSNTKASSSASSGRTFLPTAASGFNFVASNNLYSKPRKVGLTEIRGPYYGMIGKRILQDVLEVAGDFCDGLKFSGGGFSLIPEKHLREILDIAHNHGCYVSTGGFIERILPQADNVNAVRSYLKRCKELGFDYVELSTGFLSLPIDDWCRLVQEVKSVGLKAKPELGIQWGAGGDTEAKQLESEGTSDVGGLIMNANKLLDAGADILMIESEGITENVKKWRTDVVAKISQSLPLEKLMFEAADPKVFEWYIQQYGVDVNLFIDNSQAMQLACLRSGIWGTNSTFSRVVTFKP